MADLDAVAWPPPTIRTERLVLREPEARDRAAIIELFSSPAVGAHIGGPRSRDELESASFLNHRARPSLVEEGALAPVSKPGE